MPELPDVVLYIESLYPRVVGQPLSAVHIRRPFLLRSVTPPIQEAEGKTVCELRRLGKRIVFGLQEELFLVVHLMIAGRLHWKEARSQVASKQALAILTFPTGTLLLTEAGSKRRASLHLVKGEVALAQIDPRGLEVLDADFSSFRTTLIRENHTLKRALTDPHLFSGVGNAYSDEILHAAKLSPLRWTQRLEDEEILRLFSATRGTLLNWTERLRREVKNGFPEKVTAFREGMAVHGRYQKPCPDCGSPIQRLVYAENESNYCAVCQTGGKLLADRALSRLLKGDWPRT
ncbi:MAG TPA: DNA-formamidopyrimidine glycosylase family protein, partial [Terriglobia bacterium]|nr:DNA-formamidopyrimidine glycosylase family protein [Terriglobia bacterium]